MGIDSWRPALALKLIDLGRGTHIAAQRPAFADSQWWSRERHEEQQLQALQRLVTFARAEIPWYRDQTATKGLGAERLDSWQDLAGLPVVTKEDMRADPAAFQPARDPGRSLERRTGGSTGEPFRYRVSAAAFSRQWAGIVRAWEWSGYRWGETMVTIGGRSVAGAGGGWRHRAYDILRNNHSCDASRLDAAGLAAVATQVEAIGPRLIYGYPAILCELARHYAAGGGGPAGLAALVTTSEMLFPGQRRMLAEGFGLAPQDMYGCNEVNLISAECEERDGYHLAMECCLVEIVDEQGHNLPDGEVGRIVATGLYNRSMVFLRYDTGDLGAVDRRPCACGRGLVRIRELQGRARELVRGADGSLIHGVAFNGIVLQHPWVERYQVIQDDVENLRLVVATAADPGTEARQQLTTAVTELSGLAVQLDLDGNFERTRGRKTPVIISRLETGHDH